MSKGGSDKDITSTSLREKRVRFSEDTKSNDVFKVRHTRSRALLEGPPVEEEQIPTDSPQPLSKRAKTGKSTLVSDHDVGTSAVDTDLSSKTPRSQKKKSPKKQKSPNTTSVSEKKKPLLSFPSDVTRMSPKMLMYVLECLESYEQWREINDIGFGGVYWLRVSQIPMQLGYWLLSNYEPAKNALILPDGQELHLKPADVHAVLGLPMGPKKVQLATSINDSDEFAKFYQSWRVQFGQNSGFISTKTLAHFIVHQVEAGDFFKINFAVLVVSLLIQSTQKPNANFHLLKSLMVVDEIPNYNWCEFVLESLRDCQLAWLKSDKKSYVTGPLLILMLVYVDRVVYRSRSVDRDYFTLVGWTTRALNLREKAEKEYGKFGVGSIEDVMTENVALYTVQQDVKEYVLDLAVTTKTVSDHLFLLQSKLASGSSVFPSNQTVNKLRDVAHGLLNVSSNIGIDGGANSVQHDSPRLSPDDEFFNQPEVTAALEAAEKLIKMKQSSNMSPEVYSSPEAYIHDFYVSARKMAQNMVCLDEKVEIGATNFPDNQLMKSLHSTTSLLYRSYGGCDEPAPSTLLNAGDLDDAYAIAACDAVEKAYNRKRNKNLTRSQFQRKLQGAINDATAMVTSVLPGKEVSGEDVVKEARDDEVLPDVAKEVCDDVIHDALGDIHDHDKEAFRDMDDPSRDDDNDVCDHDKSIDSEATDSNPIVHTILDEFETPPSSPPSLAPAHDRPVTRRRASTGPLAPEFCSPFVIRVTDIGTAINKLQKMMCHYVFNQVPDTEVLFDYKLHKGIRYTFKSLQPHHNVSSGIVDLWASFLNHGETRKSKNTPLRFFCSTLIFRMVTSPKFTTDKQRNKCFKNALDGELADCYWIPLKSIDMFFFPIIFGNHFFLFVFDLKNNGFFILDNMYTRASVENLYDMLPSIMQTALGEYLMNNKDTHAKGKAVKCLVPVLVKMPWRTTTNIDDCGIFTMRHMETFKGDTKWKCGLKKDDVATLAKLRLKYCASLILFKGNKLSTEIISRAKEFQKKNMLADQDSGEEDTG